MARAWSLQSALAAATGLAALVGLTPAAAQEDAPARERCYGIAEAGGNDGLGDGGTAGGATVDFQGDAWAWVAADTCLTLPLPDQADGTPRRGSFEPLERDLP